MKDAVQKEVERLTRLFADTSDEVLETAKGLIEESAFMKVTLEGLRKDITASGTTDEYQNGANQSGVKIAATLQAYNSTAKVYLTYNKQIYSLLVKSAKTEEEKDDILKELGIG